MVLIHPYIYISTLAGFNGRDCDFAAGTAKRSYLLDFDPQIWKELGSLHVNDFAHMGPWEDGPPNFPKPPKKKDIFHKW